MDTIEGSKWLSDQDLAWTLVSTAVERVHELENELGCFFDRNPDGIVHQKAFAGQTFDRTVHKGDLTGIEIINRLSEQVWSRGIDRLEEHRAVELIKTADGSAHRRRADDRHAHRRLRVRAGESGAAGHRRRPDHVQVPHAVGRQDLRRPGDGAARGPAAARHGDGAVPPDRAARRHRHAHDRHGARRGPARRGRLPAERRRSSASWNATTRGPNARRATSSRARSTPRCAPAAPRRTAASICRCRTSGRTTCASSSRAWSSAAATAASIWRAVWSKSCRPRTT